mmetsp:Transcript_15751/g.47258  ORF Transcript_15751/g.47258 Transcript_15751/m.47258 type:complete len:206 (+) Transcript_15751:555-1172(+)
MKLVHLLEEFLGQPLGVHQGGEALLGEDVRELVLQELEPVGDALDGGAAALAAALLQSKGVPHSLVSPVQGLDPRVEDVEGLRPGYPSPAAHDGPPAAAPRQRRQAGEVRRRQLLALHLHAIQVVHRVHTSKRWGFLHVEVVGHKLCAAYSDAGVGDFAGLKLLILRVQVEVRIHEVEKLPLHSLLRRPNEVRLGEGHLLRAELC